MQNAREVGTATLKYQIFYTYGIVWWCLVVNFELLVVKIEKVIDFSKLDCQLHGGTALFNIFQKLLLVYIWWSFGSQWLITL